MMRFNHNANTYEDALNYIHNRAIQLLKYGVELEYTQIERELGVSACFKYNNELYQSLYILESERGKGKYQEFIKLSNQKVITHTDCQLAPFLRNHNIPFLCLGSFENVSEYKWIQDYYGDKKARRSGVYLMNHIDEGLRVLEDIGASINAKKAYCIHPIFQGDDELLSTYNSYPMSPEQIDPEVIITTMEYRSVANEYLSKRTINSLDEIRLSPLKDVNDMLIADKVQNYKDFELYHKDTHPRTKELDQYFKNWLEKLNISNEQYNNWKQILTIKK